MCPGSRVYRWTGPCNSGSTMGIKLSNFGFLNFSLQLIIVAIYFRSNRETLKLLDLTNLTGLQVPHLSPARRLPSFPCATVRSSPPPPPLQVAGSARPSFTEFSKIERSRAKTARNRAKKKRRGSFLLKQAVLAKAQRVEEGSAYHLLTVRSERVVRFHATAEERSQS